MTVSFTVEGRPQPRGSKKAFPRQRKDGRLAVAVVDMNPHGRAWMDAVAAAAAVALPCASLPAWSGPVGLDVTFYMPRPRAHFRTGRFADQLRVDAPTVPTTAPDTTKLLRAVEDALTGVAWRDDAQVVFQIARKRYGDPGARVCIYGAPDLDLVEQAA